jgi:hypothetical protein
MSRVRRALRSCHKAPIKETGVWPARIRAEHTAVSTALKQSLAHAMAAGDALIEAKQKVR